MFKLVIFIFVTQFKMFVRELSVNSALSPIGILIGDKSIGKG